MKTSLILMIILFGVCFTTVIQAQPVIIDHTCTDINQIPQQWIEAAKSNLRISYGHTSHGSQLVTGINAIRDFKGAPYGFTSVSSSYVPGVFLVDRYPPGDLGNPDRITWAQRTRDFLNQPGNDRNVIMWSWCYQMWGTEEEINTYLNLMNQLEQDFPNVKFVYMTGHLSGAGSDSALYQRAEQIRNYVRSHNKILFDFADIESYDPDGLTNYMELYANDNCDYDSDGNRSLDANWAVQWINANPDSELTQIANQCGECAHSQTLNCVLKGGAFWWLMARVAGWDGGGGDDNFTLTITKSGIGNGTVTSDPPGIDCGPDCSNAYTVGTVVTLSAQAYTGSIFTGWSGACSGTNPLCVLTMDDDLTVTASYDTGISDVPLGYWAHDYINAIYNAHITTGYGDGRYGPEDLVTREQMAAFIVRAVEGEPPPNYCDSGSLFPDLKPDMWSCKYIKRLKELEITTGYSDGRYGPYDIVPREQMATFLVRAVEGEPPLNYCDSGSLFTDVTPGMWSCIYIKRLKELKITTGYGDGRYGPYDFATRAQMAAFLSRAFLGME